MKKADSLGFYFSDKRSKIKDQRTKKQIYSLFIFLKVALICVIKQALKKID